MRKAVNRKSWLTHQLRRLSIRWPPKNNVYKENRRELPRQIKKDGTPFKKPNFEHQCNNCKEWFRASKIEMDHIIPVVNFDAEGLSEEEFLGKFAVGLFCFEDNWQKICLDCHKLKTDVENKTRKK